MTKENLVQYRTLKLELSDIQTEIRQKHVQDSVQGSMKDYPYILCTRRVDGVTCENYTLLEREADIKSKIKEIEDFIIGIKDTKTRNIFRMKYIQGKTNQRIACHFDYCSEGTVRNIIEKYLMHCDNCDLPML